MSMQEKKYIDFLKCGKIIISSNRSEDEKLTEIKNRAYKNCGLILKVLNKSDLRCLETQLSGTMGLLSESTGIIDTYQLMQNFIYDIEGAGGVICYNSSVEEILVEETFYKLKLNTNNFSINSKHVINSTGLNS